MRRMRPFCPPKKTLLQECASLYGEDAKQTSSDNDVSRRLLRFDFSGIGNILSFMCDLKSKGFGKSVFRTSHLSSV